MVIDSRIEKHRFSTLLRKYGLWRKLWEPQTLGLPRLDALAWGPRLRCFAPRTAMDIFIRDVVRDLPPFVLFGSGDFHHLTAAFLRKVPSAFNLIAFDNHPDWDRRPP